VESDLEQWARIQIANAGGMMLKWTSPGTKGVPDNIVFWPRKIILFPEFKNPDGTGEVGPLQDLMHKRLKFYGHDVPIIDNKALVREFINQHSR